MSYGALPCRHCGNPTFGTKNADYMSFCCSRDKCIKADDKVNMTNRDKPLKTITKEKWKKQLILDSRGY